jgi:hypothetical protein
VPQESHRRRGWGEPSLVLLNERWQYIADYIYLSDDRADHGGRDYDDGACNGDDGTFPRDQRALPPVPRLGSELQRRSDGYGDPALIWSDPGCHLERAVRAQTSSERSRLASMGRPAADQICTMTADRSTGVRLERRKDALSFGWAARYLHPGRSDSRQRPRGGGEMILSTAKIEDFDRFWKSFSTKGAAKRKQYGSNGAQVFRDPTDADRIWVVFDWDEEGYKNFLSDPDMPAIFKESGLQGTPEAAELVRQHDA